MAVLLNLTTTCAALTGGASGSDGTGEDWRLAIGGRWATGDEVTLILTDAHTGLQTQIGAGNITGIAPNFAFTFNNKVYMLAGSTAYFSELAQPILWNDPNGAGNGFITMSNYYATTDPLAGIAPFQGQLLFASRRSVLIWATDPDPANYALTQVLANIGTFAGETLQPVGDEDVYMLADNGVRSARVRVATDNAIIADVGTPIDAILQPILDTLTDAQKATSCGTVDPASNRYWVYVPGTGGTQGLIYTFSYFPSSGIAAWSTYTPSYETVIPANSGSYNWTDLVIGSTYVWTPGPNTTGFTCGTTTFGTSSTPAGGLFTATSTNAAMTSSGANDGTLTLVTQFVPQVFRIYKGQIWCRDTNGNIYQYGGANNNTYSACGASGITPYLNCDAPATRKFFRAIEAAFQGSWTVNLSSDYDAQTYTPVYNNTDSSFQRGRVPVNRYGTHYSFDFEEYGTGYARFSSAVMHFEPGDEK